MNNQKSLFKKFFVNKNEKENVSNSSGFNPPKFHFDKKKLGVVITNNSRMNEPQNHTNDDDKVMKDIESAEIDDSDLGDHLDDWNRTIDAPDTTMNTKIIDVITTKESQSNNSNMNAYQVILKKNHQKYNLSNQLEHFSESIENQIRNCENQRNKMELLVLGMDEKIGKSLGISF